MVADSPCKQLGAAFRMIRYVTDFADQALILPTIVLIAVWLLLAEPRRTAMAWVASCAFVLGSLFLLKLLLPCTHLAPLLRSPSGHTASAVLVAGGLLVLLVGQSRRHRWLAVGAGIVAGAGIGATRVLLHAHTLPEVVIGAIIGTLGLVLFARTDLMRPRLPPVTLMVGFVLLAALLHGTRLHAEEWIGMMSCRLN